MSNINEPLSTPPPGRQLLTVAAGQTTPWIRASDDCVVHAAPGPGGAMLVEATWEPWSRVEADNANGTSQVAALPWDAGVDGVVEETTALRVSKATAVRFTAETTAGKGGIAR